LTFIRRENELVYRFRVVGMPYSYLLLHHAFDEYQSGLIKAFFLLSLN